MSNSKKAAPKFEATHIYMGGDKLVFFNIGEKLVRLGDSPFEASGIYQNEDGTKQHVHEIDVKEI